ncbi:hypothetical protein ULMS_05430 [Patiriisocius marinistellae]|uniref:STAS/SEC14 domain-containing protein n=1 Tax=Patiriisocius marinistellae TaxID=2494560 RepID=A0A5J4FYC2_9FLAO|nr:STAS/SEC14 domain-containing protein [Patiriisocius marinistellae]GEQ85035.1 hypothetical protein ULMS_05430 [Patiriisocius marinistellae]
MQLKKIENTNIYEFKSSEKLNEEDAERLNKAFKEFEENGEKINLLGTIEKLPMPQDFPAFDELFKLKKNSINVIEKYAIVCDKKWLNNFMSIGNFFTPGIPMKSFDTNSRDEAIAWLKQKEVKTYKVDDYFSNIDIKEINKKTYEVNLTHDKINHAAMTALYNLMNDKKHDDKLNLIAVFKSFPTFEDLKTIIQGIKIDIKAIGIVEKYAVVSDAKWIESFTKLGDFLVPGLDMKFFSIDEIDAARKWATKS